MPIPRSDAPKSTDMRGVGHVTPHVPAPPAKVHAPPAPPKPPSLEDQMSFAHREIDRAEKRVKRVKLELDALIQKHNASLRK